MKVMAILVFMLGILALVVGPQSRTRTDREQNVAMNFIQYRQAVMAHVLNHPNMNGVVNIASLTLPAGWQRLRDWQARVSQHRLYIWGTASRAEAQSVREKLFNSWSPGHSEQGILQPLHDGVSIQLPQFIPDGCVVSLLSLE